MQSADATFRLLTVDIKDVDTSTDGLTAKMVLLEERLQLQNRAVQEYQNILRATREQQAAAQSVNDADLIRQTTDAVTDAETALTRAQTAVRETEQAIVACNTQLTLANSGWFEAAESIRGSEASIAGISNQLRLAESEFNLTTAGICPVCGHRLYQHEVKGHKGMSGWHCDRDEDSCRRYIARTKLLDRAILEAVNGLDAAKLKAVGYAGLAAFRRRHWRIKTVDYYWLDEYVEKLVFGRGHTLTVHWKCGLQTTVKMRVTCDTNDPVKLAEMTMAEGS